MIFRILLPLLSLHAQTPLPSTGREVPELAPYETALRQIMQKWSIPGASLAITDGSRLVYARGIGFADREAGTLVQPTSSFRLASISKTIAAMTVMKLVEEGKINLDRPFVEYIPDLKPISTPPPDPRVLRITVRQLLQHTGGWDREVENDHTVFYNTAANLFREPVSIDLISRFILSQRLDFEPGSKYSYSQSGYQLLGRVIERVTGKKFMDAVQEKILGPAGVTSVRTGGNLLSDRFPDEVRYYDYPGAPLTTTGVAPGVVLPAPRPYNRRVDMSDAYGGLIGHSVDLMRYLLALEGRRGSALLSPATIQTMLQRPSPAVHPATGNYVGLCWRITPLTSGANWWHSGGASGTRNLMLRRQDGRSWVVLMNSRPQDEDTIISEIFNAFQAAQGQVRSWPSHDLFPEFTPLTMTTNVESLTFDHVFGAPAPPAPRTIQVAASTANSPVAIDPPAERWLKVDRLSGSTPLNLQVSADPAGLSPGEYTSQLRVAVTNATNGPRSIRVVLRVAEPPKFTRLLNSASQLPVTFAAPGSRMVVETEDPLATVHVNDIGATVIRRSEKQTEFVVPMDVAPGDAVLNLITDKGQLVRDRIQVVPLAPAIFTANRKGTGAPLGIWVRTLEDGSMASEPAYQCGETAESCEPVPGDLGGEADKLDLDFQVNGVRGATDPAALSIKIGDEAAEVLAVADTDGEPGVSTVKIRIPRALLGRGEVDLVVIAAEITSNSARANFR